MLLQKRAKAQLEINGLVEGLFYATNRNEKFIIDLGCVHLSLVITTAQLHLTKPELRFCTGSNSNRGLSKICDGKNI